MQQRRGSNPWIASTHPRHYSRDSCPPVVERRHLGCEIFGLLPFALVGKIDAAENHYSTKNLTAAQGFSISTGIDNSAVTITCPNNVTEKQAQHEDGQVRN